MVQSVARETGLGQGELRGKEEGIAVHRKLDDADNRLNGDIKNTAQKPFA